MHHSGSSSRYSRGSSEGLSERTESYRIAEGFLQYAACRKPSFGSHLQYRLLVELCKLGESIPRPWSSGISLGSSFPQSQPNMSIYITGPFHGVAAPSSTTKPWSIDGLSAQHKMSLRFRLIIYPRTLEFKISSQASGKRQLEREDLDCPSCTIRPMK